MQSSLRSAFTLVELSIVLVILGLLTGGILTGQSLIRAAELRAVVTEYQRYQTSFKTFRDRYNALPGDMKNATAFWGTAATCPATNAAPLTSAATCNGDGDATVNDNDGYIFWHHLANAGLVEGSYTGAPGSGGGNHVVVGQNAPASKLGRAGWSVNRYVGPAGGTVFYGKDYINPVMFGLAHPTDATYEPALKPEEAWNIDMKIDDGIAGSGRLVATYWDTCTDAATELDYTSDYLLQTSSVQCGLVFLNTF